jgi:hypothetical protein
MSFLKESGKIIEAKKSQELQRAEAVRIEHEQYAMEQENFFGQIEEQIPQLLDKWDSLGLSELLEEVHNVIWPYKIDTRVLRFGDLDLRLKAAGSGSWVGGHLSDGEVSWVGVYKSSIRDYLLSDLQFKNFGLSRSRPVFVFGEIYMRGSRDRYDPYGSSEYYQDQYFSVRLEPSTVSVSVGSGEVRSVDKLSIDRPDFRKTFEGVIDSRIADYLSWLGKFDR